MAARPEAITTTLDHVLSSDPGRAAVEAPSGRLSYEALDAASNAAAAALGELGVKPGDRVAVTLPSDLDIVVAFHGAMRLGAIWVGVNRALDGTFCCQPPPWWRRADTTRRCARATACR